MATPFPIMRGTPRATPSPFSLAAFDKLLCHMANVITLERKVDLLRHGGAEALEKAQEASANMWVTTEKAVHAFLRAHDGETAVPLLVDTMRDLADLFDLETPNRLALRQYLNTAMQRRSKALRGTDVRVLLSRAIPLLHKIALLQATFYTQDYAETAA